MFGKKAPIVLFLSSGLFLFLDRFLKWQATHGWSAPRLVGKYFGWQPFFNPGIGFGIPVPGFLIILLTVLILVLLAFLLAHQIKIEKYYNVFALLLIFIGAVSNLVDRIWYGYTVDYFFLLTGYINLADVMIVAGFLLYICFSNSTRRR